jgi:pantetheine-phosphate adenylyltransferase
MVINIEKAWKETCAGLGVHPDAEVYALIFEAYSQKTRRYHSLWHLEHCISLGHRHFFDYPSEAMMALFFHDFVYDTHRDDALNVADSAEECGKLLEKMYVDSGMNPDMIVIDRVKSYILTTTHTDPPKSGDESLIMDIDISMIAAYKPDEIENWIREEYAWVPFNDYRRARKNILINLYLRGVELYHTSYYRSKFGADTRNRILHMIQLNGAVVALGGTFDLLHVGHEALITEAFRMTANRKDGRVIIGLTSDEMASKKSHPVQPYGVRERQLENLIKRHRYHSKWLITRLDDPVGDLGTNPFYDILVASEETRKGAEYVNELRKMIGLNPVILDLINVVTDRYGKRISSTMLRKLGETG